MLDVLDALAIIAKNYPWCPEWDDNSFRGQLYEDGVWSREEYWQLEWAMYELVSATQAESEVRWRIFRIFSSTFMSISAHFDRNDLFKIRNLKREELNQFRERFQLVFEGYFSGNMPNLCDSFDEQNPLLSADI